MSSFPVQRLDKIAANLDINLDNCVVTYKTAARLLLSIIEFLSYNRNQIPLVYETFNHLVQNLENCSNSKTNGPLVEVKNFAIERQRELAVRTNKKFHEISEILIASFKQCEIGQAIIAFGSTIFTAKEAFIINLPSIAKNHLPENHLDSLQTITRKVIMSIISSTKFFDVNSNELKPTNMFIFIKPKNTNEPIFVQTTIEQYKRHDNFKLPLSCRTTVLNIENNCNSLSANCCGNLDVFSDSKQLNIDAMPSKEGSMEEGDNDDQSKTDNDDSAMKKEVPKEEKSVMSTYVNRIEYKSTIGDNTNNENNSITSFYECKVSVKGFKDQLIKGKSIWIH